MRIIQMMVVAFLVTTANAQNTNTAYGESALTKIYEGSPALANSAFGWESLYSNTEGWDNTAVGSGSLYSNLYGTGNTAIGTGAGRSCLGSGNVFIGKEAGYNEVGNKKFYLGGSYVGSGTLMYGDFSTRQILLGVSNPTGYVFKGTRTLNVIGGIITDSIRVALSGSWADYVFADNYKLKTLTELKDYITTNKHLPNIPSSSEVAANGIDVASMNVKLLEKVEELHLYILQQQRQIDELRELIVQKK